MSTKDSFCLETILPNEIVEDITAPWYILGLQGLHDEPVGSEQSRIKAYFASEDEAKSASTQLDSVKASFSIYLVQNQDWNAKWRESMQPAKITNTVWVSPTWLPPPEDKAKVWIKIEPKMAFGTGHHETTRLASRALIANKKWLTNKTVIDIGTGSGILCFIATHFGAKSALGLEIDKECSENLAENKHLNDSQNRVDFIIGTIESLKQDFYFDCLVMNMLSHEFLPILACAVAHIKIKGKVILSGILIEEREKIISEAKNVGCVLIRERQEKEWWSGVFRRDE